MREQPYDGLSLFGKSEISQRCRAAALFGDMEPGIVCLRKTQRRCARRRQYLLWQSATHRSGLQGMVRSLVEDNPRLRDLHS